MEFVCGSEKEFSDFVLEITKKDRIAILSHTDCDGICSGVLLEEVLEHYKIKPKLIEFLNYDKYMLEKMAVKLRKLKINKVFISDLNVDSDNLELFEKFRGEFDTFLIDHHPLNLELNDKKNILKSVSGSETGFCATQIVYDLGKSFLDEEKWAWIVCAAIVADYQFKKPENMKFIQKFYPGTYLDNIFKTEPGLNASKIDYSIIHCNLHKKSISEIANCVKEKNMVVLGKYYLIIKKEIDFGVEDFVKNAEFYLGKNLYFYSNFSEGADSSAIISTIVSSEKYPHSTVVLIKNSSDKGYIRINARNQCGSENMNLLMKKGIEGLENATGGGHMRAAGAKIMRKDLSKFKQNLLKNLS